MAMAIPYWIGPRAVGYERCSQVNLGVRWLLKAPSLCTLAVNESEGNTTIRDTPGCMWFVAGMFLFVGTIFVLGPLGLFTNNAEVPLWTRGLAFVMGFVGVGTGVWLLWRSPSVATTIDVRRRRVIIRERGLAGRRERELEVGEI